MKKKTNLDIVDLQRQVAGLRIRLNRIEEYLKYKDTNTHIPDEEDDVDDKYFYNQTLKLVMEKDCASPALLQRELKIDYPRATRLMNTLEDNGIIGPSDGAKPRKVVNR